MSKIKTKNSVRMAMITGVSLILMAVIAGYAYGYAFQKLYVTGDSSATFKNVTESPDLLRNTVFCFLIIFILDVIVAWATYFFFKRVDKPVAILSSWLRLMYTAILGVSIANLMFASQFLQGTTGNIDMVYKYLNNFLDVWALGLFVISIHIILLGHLMLKSGFIPKILGVITVFAGFCYMASNASHLLLPNYEVYKGTVDLILTLPMAAGELGLAFWLLKWGIKERKSVSFKNSLSYPA